MMLLIFSILRYILYIIFAGLLSSMFKEIPYVEENEGFFLGTQWFSVLVLGVLIFPLIIKKKIQELKIAGILLFSSVVLFMILMLILKLLSGDKLVFHHEDKEAFYSFQIDQGLLFVSIWNSSLTLRGYMIKYCLSHLHTISLKVDNKKILRPLSSLSTALVAYGFQSAFFPIYNSLSVK
jgi:amino acid permease